MKPFLIVILFSIRFILLSAQENPGYLGKKAVVAINTSFFPFEYLNKNARTSTPIIGFTIERSISRKTAVELSFSAYSLTQKNETINHSATNFYFQHSDDQQSTYNTTILGSGKTKHQNYGITIKKYLQKKGSLAPLGKFILYKFQVCKWQQINPNYAAYYEDNLGKQIEITGNGQPGSQKLYTLGIGMGKRIMYDKNIIVGYSIGVNAILFSSVPAGNYLSAYSNQSDYISAIVQRNVRAINTLDVKIEIGYLF